MVDELEFYRLAFDDKLSGKAIKKAAEIILPLFYQ